MMYDMQRGESLTEMFEYRYAREHTNDNGEVLLGETAIILFFEFRKFMYVVARDILHKKAKGTFEEGSYHRDKTLGCWCYTCPFFPSYNVDQVWRFLIGLGKPYQEFCYAICGGLIERDGILPGVGENNFDDLFAKYNLGRDELIKSWTYLKPYWGLWPKFKDAEEFSTDFLHSVIV